jgi:hypothetical protein
LLVRQNQNFSLADSFHLRTHSFMNALTPSPEFNSYYKACRKGDPAGKAVAVNESPVAVLAAAREITGLPRDNFEIHEISKAEFEALYSEFSRIRW